MARALVLLVLLIVPFRQAAAAEWRYCLAPSQAGHKVYISPPFPMAEARHDPESEFADMLKQAWLPHDDVQCPRSDAEASALIMREQAINFNRKMGDKIIALKWKP